MEEEGKVVVGMGWGSTATVSGYLIRRYREDSQTHLSIMQQDKGQWSQTAAREIPTNSSSL